MTRPDWASEAEWEKARRTVGGWMTAGDNEANAALVEAVARALIQAKNEGKREAAEIALGLGMKPARAVSLKHEENVAANNGRLEGSIDIHDAILSAIPKEPT